MIPATGMPKAKTLQCTPQLRLAICKQTTVQPPRLQQAWRDVDTGEIEWVAVPFVVDERLEP